jgi:Flp pilus assembly protein TadG
MNLRSRVRHSRGAELVELALILPILLIIIAGIVDFGFMFQAFMVVNNAAREGARVRILPGYTNADATARVNNYVTASGLAGTATTSVNAITIPTGGAGAPSSNGVRVTVRYPYTFTLLGPVLAASGITSVMLTATSAMRSEM